MRRPRTIAAAFIAISLALAVAVGLRLYIWDSHGGSVVASASAIGGPFSLVDGDGRPVTDAEYRGRYMLIYFGYTFCPDVCPTSLGVVAGALDQLPASMRKRIVPIFITVDPKRDTPAVVKDYAAAFAPDMVGLSGSEEQVAAAVKAYKVYAAKTKADESGSYTVDHSSILYLMDREGKFLAHFPHGTSAEQLVAGLKKHLP